MFLSRLVPSAKTTSQLRHFDAEPDFWQWQWDENHEIRGESTRQRPGAVRSEPLPDWRQSLVTRPVAVNRDKSAAPALAPLLTLEAERVWASRGAAGGITPAGTISSGSLLASYRHAAVKRKLAAPREAASGLLLQEVPHREVAAANRASPRSAATVRYRRECCGTYRAATRVK